MNTEQTPEIRTETAMPEEAAETAAQAAAQVPEATASVPDDETLLTLCEAVRAQFPRMNGEHMIASAAFRDLGEKVGWDKNALAAGLPGLLEDAQALMQAAEPPVSRVTGTASVRRRALLSPHQQRELADWNRANPQYKMTELEYYSALKNG